MSFTVREKYLWEQMTDEMFASRLMGKPHFVLPGTSATHSAFMNTRHKKVFTNPDDALEACVSGRGDAIIFAPGAHTATASLAASKNLVSWWGPEAWMRQPVRKSSASLIGPAGDQAINFTGADNMMNGLTCIPITAQSFADMTAAADGLTIRNCYIDLITPVVNAATKGFTASAAIENFLFESNYAESDGAQGPAVELTGNNIGSIFRKNRWHVNTGTWVSAVNLIAPDGILVEEDIATCGGTAMTACYTGSGSTVVAGVVFRECRKGVLVTKFIDGFATTSHAEIVNNYTATIGGGTGSTLITVIT